MEETGVSKKGRKEEGKRLKRQRIEQAGGVRPRSATSGSSPQAKKERKMGSKPQSQPKQQQQQRKKSSNNTMGSSSHRFGRVMEQVPDRNQPRFYTLSIAIPSSVVANCQTRELKTQITGQIARAATIYHVDEIIVFDDKLSRQRNHNHNNSNFYRNRPSNNRRQPDESKEESAAAAATTTAKDEDRPRSSDPQTFMAHVLQYCECPQYLRRHFFPMHPDLQFAGLLAPMDAPHHVRAEDHCEYREGVVLDKKPPAGSDGGSLVNCGIRGRPVLIDQRLQPGIRCTVQIQNHQVAYGRPGGTLRGKVVSPRAVTRGPQGTYWGYTCRMAPSLTQVWQDCPFDGQKYDLIIGTSERGTEQLDDPSFSLSSSSTKGSSNSKPSSFRHALLVFGGIAGIEECVDADESVKVSGSNSHTLFDKWINICPHQGSRTIRTEEAVLIALAKLSPFLHRAADNHSASTNQQPNDRAAAAAAIQLVEKDAVSDESSEDESSTSGSSEGGDNKKDSDSESEE